MILHASNNEDLYKMVEINDNLLISAEEFTNCYNYDFTRWLKQDYNGSDYLSWSVVFRILKELFPLLAVEFVGIDSYGSGKEDDHSSMLKVRLHDLSDNCVSPIMHYPVMGNRNEGLVNPTSRQVSDSLQRAYVKCIAINTGIGFRVFTRDDIDLQSGGSKNHPKFKALSSIANLIDQVMLNIGSIPDSCKDVSFGNTVPELRVIYKELAALLKGDPSKPEVVSPPTYYEYKTFTMPSNWINEVDAITWAMEFAGLSEEQAYADRDVALAADYTGEESHFQRYFHYIIDEYVDEESVV